MLLDSHNLYAIVTASDYAGQYLFTEFVIGRYTLLFARHADMAFIDKQGGGIGLKLLHLEFIRCGLPHLGTEEIGGFVLYHTTYISGNTLARATFPIHLQFVVILVLDGIGREFHFPITMAIEAGQFIFFFFLPLGKITDEVHSRCIGCPLTEGPSLLGLVQTIIFVSFGNVFQFLRTIVSKFVLTTHIVVVAALDRSFVRFKPRVILDEFKHDIP